VELSLLALTHPSLVFFFAPLFIFIFFGMGREKPAIMSDGEELVLVSHLALIIIRKHIGVLFYLLIFYLFCRQVSPTPEKNNPAVACQFVA
jgi:hypothetical protein